MNMLSKISNFGRNVLKEEQLKISQTYITDTDSKKLPPLLKKTVAAIQEQKPDAKHKIYNCEELRSFISNHICFLNFKVGGLY